MGLSIVIQAGGESRRMGQNKALIPFLGHPLIARVIERVAPLADELLITANEPEVFHFTGLPVYPDLLPGQGALSGLYTALSAASLPLVAVVACDMPFVSAPLLSAQLAIVQEQEVDGVVPRSAEEYEPFHAVYRRDACLAAVQDALAAGEKRLISWFPKVNLVFLAPEEAAQYDPDGEAFINVNTPEEWKLAEERAKGR